MFSLNSERFTFDLDGAISSMSFALEIYRGDTM
jgi:hypothetical protein